MNPWWFGLLPAAVTVGVVAYRVWRAGELRIVTLALLAAAALAAVLILTMESLWRLGIIQ